MRKEIKWIAMAFGISLSLVAGGQQVAFAEGADLTALTEAAASAVPMTAAERAAAQAAADAAAMTDTQAQEEEEVVQAPQPKPTALVTDKSMGSTYNVVVDSADGGCNLRQGPGTEFSMSIPTQIPNGTVLVIKSVEKSTTGSRWGQTNYNGNVGYVALTQTKETDSSVSDPGSGADAVRVDYYAIVSAQDGVNLRGGAGFNNALMLTGPIPSGTVLHVSRECSAPEGGKWGYTTYNNVDGWVALSQVQNMSESTDFGGVFSVVDSDGKPIDLTPTEEEGTAGSTADAARDAASTAAVSSEEADAGTTAEAVAPETEEEDPEDIESGEDIDFEAALESTEDAEEGSTEEATEGADGESAEGSTEEAVQGSTEDAEEGSEGKEESKLNLKVVIPIAVGGVAAVAAVLLFFVLKKKKSAKAAAGGEEDGESSAADAGSEAQDEGGDGKKAGKGAKKGLNLAALFKKKPKAPKDKKKKK